MKSFLTLCLIFSGFSGCLGPDIPFHSEATYLAVKTGYEMAVVADGAIKDGADIADLEEQSFGVVEFRDISARGVKKNISLEVSHEQYLVCRIGEGASFVVEWDFKTRDRIFSGFLREAGYGTIDADEIKESLDAMYGVMYGPKATSLKGQTEYIEVVRVETAYEL